MERGFSPRRKEAVSVSTTVQEQSLCSSATQRVCVCVCVYVCARVYVFLLRVYFPMRIFMLRHGMIGGGMVWYGGGRLNNTSAAAARRVYLLILFLSRSRKGSFAPTGT
jgi:hypothetical protein